MLPSMLPVINTTIVNTLSSFKLPPHLQHFRGPQGAIMETDHVFPRSAYLMIHGDKLDLRLTRIVGQIELIVQNFLTIIGRQSYRRAVVDWVEHLL